MKFLFIYLSLFLLTFNISSAQYWEKNYAHENEEVYEIFPTLDTGYIFYSDQNLTKLNKNGDTLWTNNLWANNFLAYENDFIADGNGGYIFFYLAPTGTSYGLLNVKGLDNQGNFTWSSSLSSLGQFSWYSARHCRVPVQKINNNFYYLTNDDVLIKIDNQGNFLQQKTYASGDLSGSAIDSDVNSNGELVFMSSKTSPDSIFMITADAQGDILTSIRISVNYTPTDFRVTTSGDYIILGNQNNDIFLTKINSLGTTVWQKTYGGIYAETANQLKKANDGGFIIAGTTASFGAGQDDVYLIKTNASGDSIWTRTYGGIYDDHGDCVSETLDGGIIIGGTRGIGPSQQNMYAIKTSNLGQLSINTHKIKQISNLSYFPNPIIDDYLHIDLGKQYTDIHISVFNAIGEVIGEYKFDSQKEVQPKIEGGSGVYFVKINTSMNETALLKIIKL